MCVCGGECSQQSSDPQLAAGLRAYLRCPGGGHPDGEALGYGTRRVYRCVENGRLGDGPVLVLHTWTRRPQSLYFLVDGLAEGSRFEWKDDGYLESITTWSQGERAGPHRARPPGSP